MCAKLCPIRKNTIAVTTGTLDKHDTSSIVPMVQYKRLVQQMFYIIYKFYKLKYYQHSTTKQCN